MVLGAVKLSLLSVIRDNWRDCDIYSPIWHSEPGLSVEAAGLASCCQQWSHQDWKGGGLCYHQGGLAAASRVTVRTSSPGTHCSLFSSTCSSRKKRQWLSVTSSQAIMGLCIWAIVVTQMCSEKKCFSWTFYTEAVWQWVTSKSVRVWARTL